MTDADIARAIAKDYPGFCAMTLQRKTVALRLVRLMLESDGFGDTYCAYLADNGGLNAAGIAGVEHFMDNWNT